LDSSARLLVAAVAAHRVKVDLAIEILPGIKIYKTINNKMTINTNLFNNTLIFYPEVVIGTK
jgi:hypothetical protein